MEKNKGGVKTRFSRILWAVMAVVMFTVTYGWAEDITDPIDGPYYSDVDEVVNVYADITYGLFANIGSKVNIYAGAIGDGQNFGIDVSSGTPSPVVTVYGTNFSDSSGPISADQWDPTGSGGNVLTVTYTDENGDPIGDPVNLLFYSDIPINLVDTAGGPEPGPEEITIDIKPGSTPNAINLGSNGVIPVAILSTADFDATSVNPDTVFLAGSGVAVRGKGNKLLASEQDVNGDSLLDLVVKVETENLDPGSFQDGYAILQVIVENTVIYEGADEITIVPPE